METPVTLSRGAAHAAVLLVVVSELGRNSAGARELTAALGEAGYSVLGVDLRGWGETKTLVPQPKQRVNWEDFFAWRAIELGRPLLGMRVADLLGAIGRARPNFEKIYVVGLEAGGLVALHAAVVENSLAGVATVRTLQSYEDVMSRQRPEEPVSSLVWDALANYDLPDLARSIQPRPYVQVNSSDAMRRPLAGDGPKSAQAVAREILHGLHL
jgi:pimeloyl-ACP methyl ester carboxylesterase